MAYNKDTNQDEKERYLKDVATPVTSYSGAGALGYDDNPDFDYSRYIGQLMDAGYSDVDELSRLRNERSAKALNIGMSQYANDDFARSVDEYIAGLRSKQAVTAQAPAYTPVYQDQLKTLAEQLLSRNPFSYDPATDPLYSSYRKQYTREGQRASADALAQASAMTGGMPSTAAVAAATQAGDYYAAKMADVIPELYQLAYSMYQNEGDQMRQNLSTLRALEQDNVDLWTRQLGQFNTDRSFKYGVQRDAVADEQQAWQNRYNEQRDAVADEQQAWQNKYNAAILAAEYGDYTGLAELGITPNLGNIEAMTRAGSSSLLKGSSGGGSSGSGKKSTPSATTTEDDFWSEVEDYVAIGGDATDYIKKNWKSTGLFSSQTAALSAWNVHNTQSAKRQSRANPMSVTKGNLASIDYDEDEGVFTWNGRDYWSAAELADDLNAAIENGSITEAVEAELKRKLKAYGFDA